MITPIISQQLALQQDIKSAATVAELQALASLESEYPLTFDNTIRDLIGNRLANFIARHTRPIGPNDRRKGRSGRKRSIDRCACGRYTRHTAKVVYHHCAITA